MRVPTVIVAATLALVACGKSGTKDVTGTWKLDMEKALEIAVSSIEEAMRALPTPPEGLEARRKEVRERSRQLIDAMAVEIEFKRDGTFQGRRTANGQTTSGLAGTWKDEGATVVMTPTEGAGSKDAIRLTKRDGHLEFDQSGVRIVLTRK